MQVKKNSHRSFNGVGGNFCAETENNNSGLSQDSDTDSRINGSQMSGQVSTKFVKL